MRVHIPATLVASCGDRADRLAWLEQLPERIVDLARLWKIQLEAPFEGNGSAAWVAPATRRDGARVIFKAGLPHMEGEQEIAGLRFWAGDPAVHLLEADEARGAMLIERCFPGHSLRVLPEPEQDVVIATLIRRMWRRPSAPAFRPLSDMIAHWRAETRARSAQWLAPRLVLEGLEAFEGLVESSTDHVLLGTDVHAGNVLRATREPWLVIDPKPFVGDPAYDATQHLLNCRRRLRADPAGLITRVARLLGVDAMRAQGWLFARLAAEPRDSWDTEAIELAGIVRQAVL